MNYKNLFKINTIKKFIFIILERLHYSGLPKSFNKKTQLNQCVTSKYRTNNNSFTFHNNDPPAQVIHLTHKSFWRRNMFNARLSKVLLIGICSALSQQSTAAKKTNDVASLATFTLEQLMDIPVSVASKNQGSLRDAPGIVTVVSEEEIINSGARDLIDILRLVPGYDFGVDVSNVVAAGIRGNWAAEGKVLVLVDGIEMNERRYASYAFGQHFPVDHIKRIEIVRGPGSVIYGGAAKLGVINIITKQAEDIEGVSLTASYGKMSDAIGHEQLTIMAGDKFGDLNISALGTKGKGHRSDQTYTDVYGKNIDMASNNELNPEYLNVHLVYKDISARIISDHYHMTDRDAFSKIRSYFINKYFKTDTVELKYQTDLNDKLKVNTSLSYMKQSPSELKHGTTDALIQQVLVDTYTGKLNFTYNPLKELQIVTGGEFYQDTFESNKPQRNLPKLSNTTLFVESLYKSEYGNLTLGLRYDNPNVAKSDFAPRVGFTKIFDKYHIKLLYSKSFHSPTIENYNLTPDIKSEKTDTYELELGYKINESMSIVTNLFDISSKDTILFASIIDNTGNPKELYLNADRVGTRGIETEFRWKDKKHYVTLNHSYYRATDSSIANFKIYDYQNNRTTTDKLFLGFPAHKISLNGHYEFMPKVSINPSLVYYSARYGYNTVDSNDNLVLHRYSPSVLANVMVRYEDFLAKGLDIGLGAHNLFNENYQFIQPYNDGHAPLPDQSREIMFKVWYSF
jgi:outer membrane receptor protein involved in Fe transport